MKTIFLCLTIFLRSSLGYNLIVSGYNTNLSIYQVSNDDYHLLEEQHIKAALNMSWLQIEIGDAEEPEEYDIVAVQEVDLSLDTHYTRFTSNYQRHLAYIGNGI